MTMAPSVEEVAAVRDGLGLDPFHVLGHSGARLARPRVRPQPPEGLAGGRSCQVTVVCVASSPVGALPFGRSREGAVWRCRAPTLMYATSPWVGHLASCRLRWHFLRRQTMIAHSEPVRGEKPCPVPRRHQQRVGAQPPQRGGAKRRGVQLLR